MVSFLPLFYHSPTPRHISEYGIDLLPRLTAGLDWALKTRFLIHMLCHSRGLKIDRMKWNHCG